MSIGALGHKPDPIHHPYYRPVRQLIGATPAPAPAEHDLMVPLADVILNQPGETCVGHGTAGAAYVRAGADILSQWLAKGLSYAEALKKTLATKRLYPAPLFIFAGACQRGQYDGLDGSRPVDAFEALGDYGYCGLDAWPDDEQHLTPSGAGFTFKQPDDAAYRYAADQRTVRAYREDHDGERCRQSITSGIAALHPATLALQIDDAFMVLTDNVWPGPTGRIAGGHYVYGVGYTPDYLWCVNSWGIGVGVNGLIKVAWSAVLDGTVCSDRYLVTYAEPAEPVEE